MGKTVAVSVDALLDWLDEQEQGGLYGAINEDDTLIKVTLGYNQVFFEVGTEEQEDGN